MQTGRQHLEHLLEQTAANDRGAFSELYDATSAKLFGVVLRILRDREVAEDVLQEVYIRVWNRARDFDPTRASPITWLATIARNKAIDELRRRKPETQSGIPIEEFQLVDPGPLPFEALQTAEDLRALEACLEGLEADKRDAIRLAYLDGCSRSNLAARFGIPLGTLKTWLHRGLKQLKECLRS